MHKKVPELSRLSLPYAIPINLPVIKPNEYDTEAQYQPNTTGSSKCVLGSSFPMVQGERESYFLDVSRICAHLLSASFF